MLLSKDDFNPISKTPFQIFHPLDSILQTPAQNPAQGAQERVVGAELSRASWPPWMQGPRLLLSASCLCSGGLPLMPDPSPPNCTWASQPGSSPGPMLQNMGQGTLCSADGEGASSAAFCLCTDLSLIPSHAELGPTWVSPKALFPGSGTTGSPFFPALGRPASSHCGTAHCCSQAAARVQGASTDLSGVWATSQACPLAPGGRGTGSSPLAETASQGHSLHTQAVNVTGLRRLCTQPSLTTRCFLQREGLLPASP